MDLTDKVAEAQRRTDIDGIPRYVTDDGSIMKCDWVITGEADYSLDGESLEEHIERLLKSTETLDY